MMISKKKFISGGILALFLLIIVFYLFDSMEWYRKSLFIVLGFAFIGVLSIANAIGDSRIISVNKFFWYFQFVFMGIAPMCQYLSGYYPWRITIENADIETAQIMVILWSSLYMLFYKRRFIHVKADAVKASFNKFVVKNRTYSITFLILLFFAAIAGFAILVKMIGFYNLFFRSENTLDIENSTINFVVRMFLRALPVMGCALFLRVNIKKKSVFTILGIIVLIAISVCSNFPTSTTRYWMGTIFIGIAFVAFIKRKKSRIVDYGIVFGLLIAFPVFYMFKTFTITDIVNGNVRFRGIINSFNTVDFDAFTVVARSVRYVRENGITFGSQLINTILFFIPRSIWTSKPITTNVLIASSQHQTFTNISCPLPAEGYVNFGWIGIFLYCLVYARINRTLDDLYWNGDDDDINIVNMAYPFLCVITLYINRGPLQPSFIQTIALILPLVVINLLNTGRSKQKGEM